MATKTKTQATAFVNLTEAEAVAKAGPLFTEDQKSSGILACVSMAQFILESGFGTSELALKANNCFGMKTSLSGNTWEGSTWDESQEYVKETKEQKEDGTEYTITAHFRKYDCVEDSIADHSAYLLGAMTGKVKRYAGLAGETDYQKAAQIIKDGGYATDVSYVEKLCNIIEKWNLTQYNVAEEDAEWPEKLTSGYYRVRSVWTDKAGQLGAYRKLSNAKTKADENPGYYVFSDSGVKIYPKIKTETVDSESKEDVDTEAKAEDNSTETMEETTDPTDETDETEETEETDSEKEDANSSETDQPPGEESGDAERGEEEATAYPNDGNDTPVLYAKLKTIMNIRKGNAVSADGITVYKKDTIVEVLEVCDNGWYRIKCDEAACGYAYVSNEDDQYAYTGRSLYKVKAGDTLWSIAGKLLGDPTRNPEIKAANGLNSTRINTGMTLLIP